LTDAQSDSGGRPRSVAVVTTVFNGEEALKKTLRSLETVAEDVPFTVFVVDDGSDPPVRIAPRPLDIILMRSDRNLGPAGARNLAVARGLDLGFEFIACLDAGDQNLAYRLSRQVAFLRAHPEIGIVGGGARLVTPEADVIGERFMPADHRAITKAMRYNIAFIHPTVMIRADAFRAAGNYDPNQKYAEDYELISRIIRKYYAANLEETLIDYEVSTIQQSHREWKHQVWWRFAVQRRYFDVTDIDSVRGFLRTLLLLLVPQAIYQRRRTRRIRARQDGGREAAE
jgi:glycosyltransferase involved in cell wall biosynthesis